MTLYKGQSYVEWVEQHIRWTHIYIYIHVGGFAHKKDPCNVGNLVHKKHPRSSI